MTEVVFFLIAGIGLLGGALGAYVAKQAPWKGAVVVLVATVASIVPEYLIAEPSWLVVWLTFLIAAGLTGRAVGLSGREIASVILGSFLISFVAIAVLAFTGLLDGVPMF